MQTLVPYACVFAFVSGCVVSIWLRQTAGQKRASAAAAQMAAQIVVSLMPADWPTSWQPPVACVCQSNPLPFPTPILSRAMIAFTCLSSRRLRPPSGLQLIEVLSRLATGQVYVLANAPNTTFTYLCDICVCTRIHGLHRGGY